MIGLIQRVSAAAVHVDRESIASINKGLLVFIGVEKGDSPHGARRLIERICGYRVFPDAEGKMNLSLKEIRGGLLLVPQFTLAANTNKGMRPSFSSAAAPEQGERLFNLAVKEARNTLSDVATGAFGADMQVSLTNQGPVTFWLQVPPESHE